MVILMSNDRLIIFIIHKTDTQLLAYFFDELVSILNEDQDLLIHLTDSVTINLLKHPVDKEKILRSIDNSHSIIGCKMLVDAVLTYLNKATDPDYANLLFIIKGNQKLTFLLEKIREKGITNTILVNDNYLIINVFI